MWRLSTGHFAEEFEPDFKKKYRGDFGGTIDNFIKLNPGGWVMPSPYMKYEKRLYNFKFLPDDILIMTYPKCGTTWMQEIVWTMRNNPNLDHPDAADALFSRSPFIDADMLFSKEHPKRDTSSPTPPSDPFLDGFYKHCPGREPTNGVMLQVAEAIPRPRTLKTHLPFSFFDRKLVDTCKVMYVARNPKDVVLSYLHHCRLIKRYGFVGSLDAFVDYFVEDLLLYGPYAEHLKEAWQLRHHPNLLWVFYEDLKKDTLGQLRRLDAFMGTELTEDQLLNVQQHTSFSNMKANDPMKVTTSLSIDGQVLQKDGGFIRNGQAGSWKGKYTAEQERKIDDWIKKNFEGHGLQFTYQ